MHGREFYPKKSLWEQMQDIAKEEQLREQLKKEKAESLRKRAIEVESLQRPITILNNPQFDAVVWNN